MIDHNRVVEVWKQGYNFRDAGKQLGITGERVRQIVLENHNKTCTRPWVRPTTASSNGLNCECIEAHRLGREARKNRKLGNPQIEAAYKSGAPMTEIASQFGVSSRALWQTVRGYSEETKAIRKTNLWKANCNRTSQQDLIQHIQAVATKIGHAPTRREYDEHVENAPSSQTVCIRFDNWSAALQAAGLTPSAQSAKASGPRSDRHWTAERINDALHYLYDDLGEIPSINKYRKLAADTPWLPSDQIVRRQLRWPEARLRTINDHASWTPQYSKLDLVDPYNRRGRRAKQQTTPTPPAPAPTAPNVWATGGEWHGSIRSA